MSNQQQARMLAATQLQLDKKLNARVISRVAEHSNFDHESERLMALRSEQHQQQQEQVLITTVNPIFPESDNEQERLIAAQTLRTDKHRQESLIARSVPKKLETDGADFDINERWWLSPATEELD